MSAPSRPHSAGGLSSGEQEGVLVGIFCGQCLGGYDCFQTRGMSKEAK